MVIQYLCEDLDSFKPPSNARKEVARNLIDRGLIKLRRAALEIADLMWPKFSEEVKEYYLYLVRKSSRQKIYWMVTDYLKTVFDEEVLFRNYRIHYYLFEDTEFRENVFRLSPEKDWYPAHKWENFFGPGEPAKDPDLQTFIELVKKNTRMFDRWASQCLISPLREISLDLFTRMGFDDLEFGEIIAQHNIWPYMSNDERMIYVEFAQHRYKVEFCRVAEEYLKNHYLNNDLGEMPLWRPSSHEIEISFGWGFYPR